MQPSNLLQKLIDEVDQFKIEDLHPKVAGLVSAFINYLKEPRYQNPLALSELKELFNAFYQDLNSLVFHIYTQLNTNKRLLLQRSHIFKLEPKTFDYLNAIANYSSSSVKLSKRSDPDALYQLRVFGFYKFLTIMKTLELAELKLYTFTHSTDSTPLYEKVLRFDLRDIEKQNLMSEKIRILRQLSLPVLCFLESESHERSNSLEFALLPLDEQDSPYSAELKSIFNQLARAYTPMSKLDQIVAIQKLIMDICASCGDRDSHQMSNDVLLPAFIYVIVKHSPVNFGEELFEFYLYFMFVKTFWNPLDLQNINASRFTLNTTLVGYNPMDRRAQLQRNTKGKSLATLLNLNESSVAHEDSSDFSPHAPEFLSDDALLSYIQRRYLNQGEKQFCLTNYEAILYFLLNTPIVGIAPEGIDIPTEILENELLRVSLQEIIEKKETNTETNSGKEFDKLLDEELDSTSRSRSSSLFNTISSAVSQSVSRSRSDSLANKQEQLSEHSAFPFTTDFETSLKQNQGTNDAYGLGRVRSIFDKIGQASHLQGKPADSDSESTHELVETLERSPDMGRGKRSQSLFDRLSPSVNRTRSGSLENLRISQNPSLRRTTLTSKFSTGMSELMTKITSATNPSTTSSAQGIGPGTAVNFAHHSLTSDHSIDDPFEEPTYTSREALGARTSSLQTMERWFCSIPENPPVESVTEHRSNTSISSNRFNTLDSNCNEESLFSMNYTELTKYRFTDFDSMTISDLKNLKTYYDLLCAEVLLNKAELKKTSNDSLPDMEKQEFSKSLPYEHDKTS